MNFRDTTGHLLARLDVDLSANGRRLAITSALTGESQYLDALLLEALTWIPGELLESQDENSLSDKEESG
ncbi:hypothetical protein [Amycolatopsis sp. NPDC051061]|uniref:hypothetical protein n=1 Tax=Amycolatopsis sp. NPDC051061 TaxID=3155042 RepID=UPI0034303E7B